MGVSEAGSEQEDLSASPPAQARGGWRPRLWALWPAAGTNGPRSGTSGSGNSRAFWYPMAALAALICAFNTVNVMSVLHNRPALDVIEPVIWEGTSALTFLLFAPLVWLAVRLAPLEGPKPRLLLHLPAMVLFSLGHVVGFMLLRKALYWALGGHYGATTLGDFFYEFRKDILGYVLAVLAFTAAAHRFAEAPARTPVPALFDIRDGASLIRVRIADILAVTAAGNYVEFVLADGRRPLMRSALAAMEAELGPQGFVRTHRSWLVNAAAVTGLTPEGSGDYTVSLGQVSVPLSRRYRAALERLRGA